VETLAQTAALTLAEAVLAHQAQPTVKLPLTEAPVTTVTGLTVLVVHLLVRLAQPY
jgi:hypothetical protein